MKLWKWQQGRQKDTIYKKFPLWYFRIWKWGFDAYILRYPKDAYLGIHRDVVENGEHHRLNVRLKGWAPIFIQGRGIVEDRFVAFRPDLHPHSVFVYEDTIKLSFGFVKFY